MRKRIVGITLLLLAAFLCGCSPSVDPTAQKAVDKLTQTWKQLYSESGRGDGYLEIKNTRIIHVKDNTANEYFSDAETIVEFILLSDYFEAAPYYINCGTYDTVVFYKDGHCEVTAMNPIDMYRSMTYTTDFSDFVEKIDDLGSACNQVLDLV